MASPVAQHGPLVSAILATRNEGVNIGHCISSLKDQSYQNVELIVVDNDSIDETRQVAREFGVKVINMLNHMDLEAITNCRGAQVNLGAEMSSGEILFFPDADMTFDNNLIAEAVRLMNPCGALHVPEIVIGKGMFGKIRNFERRFYNNTCIDAPRFVKRDLFLKVGGFDEKNINFGPDDWDLTKKLKNAEVIFAITQACQYHHEEGLKLKTYLRKKAKYAWSFDAYIAKWGNKDSDIVKQLGLRYRYFGVFVENGKWKKLVKHPLLTCGLYAMRLLVGVRYLRTMNKG